MVQLVEGFKVNGAVGLMNSIRGALVFLVLAPASLCVQLCDQQPCTIDIHS